MIEHQVNDLVMDKNAGAQLGITARIKRPPLPFLQVAAPESRRVVR